MFVEEKAKGEVRELDDGSKTLLRAAELIELKGHCNYTAYGIDGSLCVHAAIMDAAGNSLLGETEARRKLEDYLGKGNYITTWSNNSIATEVIAKLRAVAFSS